MNSRLSNVDVEKMEKFKRIIVVVASRKIQ